MNRQRRSRSDSTHGKSLRSGLGQAVKTLTEIRVNRANLTLETSSTTFHQRFLDKKTHFVDISPGFQVVESIVDIIELAPPSERELGRIGDVTMMRDKLTPKIVEFLNSLCHYQRFGLIYIISAEQKAPIQVGKSDSVEVNDMNFAKPCQDQVFQEFTPDTTSTDHQNFSL